MTQRPRIPVPLGGGLDRESGILATNASTMADLRNVHLLHGRIEGRLGLLRVAAFGGEGDVLLNIHPVRSRSMAAYLVLTAAGDVALWTSAADGSAAALVAVIPGDEVIGVQTYVLADIYDKLFIAHDEPDLTLRQPTRYYDFRTASLNTLTIGGTPARFRGVAAHLAYMLGWAWGAPGDEDRPETLRISMPGDPTTFDLQHYFLVGVGGEPITGGGAAGRFWKIKKLSHGHVLVGSDRANFGVEPTEDHIGLPRHAMGVSANGVYYFWSTDGPRREGEGVSEDLSPGLRLLDIPAAPSHPPLTATGGAVTHEGTRTTHVFDADGDFTIVSTNPLVDVTVTLVSGGAGGFGRAGGGGGGVYTGTFVAAPGTYPVVVGAGGGPGIVGQQSTFNGHVSGGGNIGFGEFAGGSGSPTSHAGGSGVGIGFGGTEELDFTDAYSANCAGGGGGAGGIGGDGQITGSHSVAGGSGGIGLLTPHGRFGGGGGGGANASGAGAASGGGGGSGGGGAGSLGVGGNGFDGLGGGGGGGDSGGGSGGRGRVILSYEDLPSTTVEEHADIDTETGFAAYDPTRREVLFVFGQWAFVYHLSVDPERWSYRVYGQPLGCGAVLWESTAGVIAVPPDPGYLYTLDAL